MHHFEVFLTLDAWLAFLTLSVMEVVLGIDNIVFLTILANRLPEAQRAKARFWGLALALLMRVGLLLSIAWVIGLTKPLFAVFGHSFSGRDLVLGGGGLFLLAKASTEIFHELEGVKPKAGDAKAGGASFAWVLLQIGVLDIVFSLDSVITAVGMADDLIVMILAIAVAIGAMMAFAGSIGALIERHPSLKVLALSFLLLIGVMLTAESLGQHIDKAYIYFAMGFSVFVEFINLRRKTTGHAPPKIAS